MLPLGILPSPRRLEQINRNIHQASPLLLTTLLLAAGLHKYLLLLRSDGGGDLLGADIPKALMVLEGDNPYSTRPWAAPYPPFHLLLIAGIISLTNTLTSASTLLAISQNIRIVAILADVSVGLVIFLALRQRGFTGLQLIIPPSLFLILPSISSTPYFWFHTDIFGYLILALSLLALTTRHYLTGSTLLALATIFKLHPILATPLLALWLVRNQKPAQALRSLLAMTTVLALGLLLPLRIPGYQETILGFNLSTGLGSGTYSFTIMTLFYAILPNTISLSLPLFTINLIWAAATTTLFLVALAVVWSRAKTLDPLQVTLLGLLVWLLPLRQLYTHYIVWAVIPFLMRGRLKETITLAVLLETANTMAVWSWAIPPNPFPAMNTIYGFFAASLAYLALNSVALVLVLRQIASPLSH